MEEIGHAGDGLTIVRKEFGKEFGVPPSGGLAGQPKFMSCSARLACSASARSMPWSGISQISATATYIAQAMRGMTVVVEIATVINFSPSLLLLSRQNLWILRACHGEGTF